LLPSIFEYASKTRAWDEVLAGWREVEFGGQEVGGQIGLRFVGGWIDVAPGVRRK
jgi:hypothetical protein